MPNLMLPGTGESSRSHSRQRAKTDAHEHRSVWDPFKKIGSWLRREEEEPPPEKLAVEDGKDNARPHSSGEHHGRPSGLLNRRSTRKVVPGLPRPLTFKRMNSEKRDRLEPVPIDAEQRRAASADRRDSQLVPKRTLSLPPASVPSMSAPDVLSPHDSESQKPGPFIGGAPDSNIPAGARQVDYAMDESIDYISGDDARPLSMARDSFYERDSNRSVDEIDDAMLQEELEAKWILNLSMHFRDLSDREKFFITYAEEPNKWRRVTVSCDYRALEPDSLEADLKSLHYQRDKSSRIYEAIRDSLPDIQFYDTVTNLKLQTADGRLHVHVTEDVNETIPYPPLSAVDHLTCRKFKESAISFDSHISGFVYKISAHGREYIKKEIPGPDAVEEFLYEINALSSLQDAKSVIKFEGVIVDEGHQLIKGLLISYAEKGALVDLLYDLKGSDQMLWPRREQWARQIVEGLSEIHEAGFVQGDFTLSNIVIDNNYDAKIIDINRRGCPVGWEPPELARLIESGQRISIYIGVKSDLFQLGMVLWALAAQDDEPERQERPLHRCIDRYSDVPQYFRNIVKSLLSDNPRDRPSAKELISLFPDPAAQQSVTFITEKRQSLSEHRPDKEYIDPAMAVDREDISNLHLRAKSSLPNVNMPSTEYVDSNCSYILPTSERGRSPSREQRRYRQSDSSPYTGRRSVLSLDDSELENELASLPASREPLWEQVYVDGDTKLVQRRGLDIDAHDFTNQEPKDICITTPPGELESSITSTKKSDDTTPLSLSTVAELPPPQPNRLALPGQPDDSADLPMELASLRHPSNKASFSDRVHQLNQTDDPHIKRSNTLTDLENEVAMDTSISSSAAPSRVGTGFSIDRVFRHPLHQDSGFNEPDRTSLDSECIRRSLDSDLNYHTTLLDEPIIEERLWDQRMEGRFGEGVRGHELLLKSSATIPQRTETTVKPSERISEEEAMEKALEEKTSNTTIRPPSLKIPEFAHGIPEAVDAVKEPEPAPEKIMTFDIRREEDETPHEHAAEEVMYALSHVFPRHHYEHERAQRRKKEASL
ncbi:hypothetical protein BU24DRAFT_340832 [Aaosphaeria arxii CBS 175.79]|uniref:non-specific serine/threonine protein kinase n=1 Tax=Aaosphaeria arxii CBS 175.79 TaxID=1450172 RepID=A0A6A5Y206_9PLEO|nr:uncharacterized protein BU24DRAFT_340832 [Aaosphaeria arxii CBS 175.79]KAF2019243.1 hypothetical protein BU24DRAFT_340832 [Aaosphaeria arxii CBS 175.79]